MVNNVTPKTLKVQRGERIWTASEIKQVLFGLINVYYTTPWYIRFLMKPWRDALNTAVMALDNPYDPSDLDNS